MRFMTGGSRTWCNHGLSAVLAVAAIVAGPAPGIGRSAGRAVAAETAGVAVLADEAVAKHAAGWEQHIRRFEDAERQSPTPAGAVLFLGSSNIALWRNLAEDFPGHTVVNRGFGGCHLADIAFFAERLVGPVQPATIVVSAGANDIHSGRTPEQVRDSFVVLATTARSLLPDVRIIYLGIATTTARLSERPAQMRAFALISAFVAEQANMEVIDLADVYCRPDGTIDPECLIDDKLHPSRKGNLRRAAIIRERLEAAPAR